MPPWTHKRNTQKQLIANAWGAEKWHADENVKRGASKGVLIKKTHLRWLDKTLALWLCVWTACESTSEAENYQRVMEPRLSYACACCFRWLTSTLQSHTTTFQHWSCAAAGLPANWPRNTWPLRRSACFKRAAAEPSDPGTGVRFSLLGKLNPQNFVCNANTLHCCG